jgi:hypothetical protein
MENLGDRRLKVGICGSVSLSPGAPAVVYKKYGKLKSTIA